MTLQEDVHVQVKAAAKTLKMRRNRSDSEDGTVQSKDTQERNKLRLVAKKMKSRQSSQSINSSAGSSNKRENAKDSKNCSRLSQTLAAMNRQTAHTHSSGRSDGSDTSWTSASSSYLGKDSYNSSCHGSLGKDNIDCSLDGSLSSIHSDISSVYSCLEGEREDDLDCNMLLYITKFWGKVKRIDGYAEDLAEGIICHMMKAHADVRRDLNLKSFRSPRFFELARMLTDTIDVLVTLLGPDIDDAELKEIGQDLIKQGISPTLFGGAVALALRDLLGEQEFSDKAFDTWERTFTRVGRRMHG